MFSSVSYLGKGQDSQATARSATGFVQSSNSASIANSQSSSSHGFASSQVLNQQSSSGDRSQSPGELRSIRHMTLSTSSSSNPSSQDQQRHRVEDLSSAEEKAQRQTLPLLRGSPNARPRSLHLGSLHSSEHINLQKRTANGEIKHAGSSLPTSPVGVGPSLGHSRNTFITSKGSQIGELSNHLRARLSYAMVKVQNGWQSHNIDELESLTSQQASPVSPATDLRRSYDFPRATFTDLRFDRTGFARSSERTTTTPEDMRPPPHTKTAGSAYDHAYPPAGEMMPLMPSVQADRTYESFWREHSTSSASRQLYTQGSSIEGPSLAPPADILPRNMRRSNPSQRQPPVLYANSSQGANYQSFTSTSSVTSTTPATPPPQHPRNMRTPSQNAAMEQDAVETLLFMSSPGNSSYHPASQLPSTPLRSQMATAKQDNVASALGHYEGSESEPAANRNSATWPGTRDTKRLTNGADIDRLLDEMPDDNSSSEDEDMDSLCQPQPYM